MEYLIVFGIALFIAILSFYLIKKSTSNTKRNDFLNWGSDEHQRAAAGRDGWDEEWYPHETL